MRLWIRRIPEGKIFQCKKTWGFNLKYRTSQGFPFIYTHKIRMKIFHALRCYDAKKGKDKLSTPFSQCSCGSNVRREVITQSQK